MHIVPIDAALIQMAIENALEVLYRQSTHVIAANLGRNQVSTVVDTCPVHRQVITFTGLFKIDGETADDPDHTVCITLTVVSHQTGKHWWIVESPTVMIIDDAPHVVIWLDGYPANVNPTHIKIRHRNSNFWTVGWSKDEVIHQEPVAA